MLDAPYGRRYRSPMRRARAAEVAVVNLAACDRCGLCLPLCPPEAIHLEFNDLVVDRGACTGCRKCVAPCPVGAGPAGCVAAAWAKRAAPELDVVLLERDRAVGTPVRCAEGVGDAGLREFANPDGASWVARKISRVIFIAPNDCEVRVTERDVGWILDRTRFDASLAAEAGALGAAVLVGTEAAGMTSRPDGRWDVRARSARAETTYQAKVVIGADGVEAMVGRWAGLETRVPARDMESCAQYVVQGIDFDPDAIYLQFGHDIAQGGYAWVFPKSVGIANVGLGLVALKSDGRNAREYL